MIQGQSLTISDFNFSILFPLFHVGFSRLVSLNNLFILTPDWRIVNVVYSEYYTIYAICFVHQNIFRATVTFSCVNDLLFICLLCKKCTKEYIFLCHCKLLYYCCHDVGKRTGNVLKFSACCVTLRAVIFYIEKTN